MERLVCSYHQHYILIELIHNTVSLQHHNSQQLVKKKWTWDLKQKSYTLWKQLPENTWFNSKMYNIIKVITLLLSPSQSLRWFRRDSRLNMVPQKKNEKYFFFLFYHQSVIQKCSRQHSQIFLFFRYNQKLDISYESSAKQTFHITWNIKSYFHRKTKKKNISDCCLLQLCLGL